MSQPALGEPALPFSLGGMLFQDDFAQGLDTSTWSTLRLTPPEAWPGPFDPSQDDYAFSRDQVTVNGDLLRLGWTRRETEAGDATYPYAAGIAHTAGTMSVGPDSYLEAQMRFDVSDGLWPAFVLYPVDSVWPPEIDIVEWVQEPDMGNRYVPHFNVHYTDDNGQPAEWNWRTYGPDDIDPSQWHTFGLLWRRNALQVFLDGVPGPKFTDSQHIPTEPMFVSLSAGVRKGYDPPDGALEVRHMRMWSLPF